VFSELVEWRFRKPFEKFALRVLGAFTGLAARLHPARA
jgi:hypothetical protein